MEGRGCREEIGLPRRDRTAERRKGCREETEETGLQRRETGL
jgi:hypothetical protein